MGTEEVTEKDSELAGRQNSGSGLSSTTTTSLGLGASQYINIFPMLSMEPACVSTWNSTEHDPAAAGLWNTPQKSSKSLAQSGGSCELFKDQKPAEKSSTQCKMHPPRGTGQNLSLARTLIPETHPDLSSSW